jgi:hypothetical protein
MIDPIAVRGCCYQSPANGGAQREGAVCRVEVCEGSDGEGGPECIPSGLSDVYCSNPRFIALIINDVAIESISHARLTRRPQITTVFR